MGAPNEAVPMPDGMEHWEIDALAECMPYFSRLPAGEGEVLWKRLWELLETYPNGGTEWWQHLTREQQVALKAAFDHEMAIFGD